MKKKRIGERCERNAYGVVRVVRKRGEGKKRRAIERKNTRRIWELVPFYMEGERGVLSRECEKRLDARRRRPLAPSLLGYKRTPAFGEGALSWERSDVSRRDRATPYKRTNTTRALVEGT